MKNVVFWDVTLCGSCKERRFELLVTANFPSSLILYTLIMMEMIRSSETSVLTRATRHHIQEDGIVQNRSMFLTFIMATK
jgi:hypothetical protein